jgi:putative MATE family efflux protein
MVLGLVSVMAASLMEIIYIGKLGTDELAAIGFTFPLVMILQGISMGLGIGASSVVARTIGLGDREKARRLITHSFVLVFILIFVFSLLAYGNLKPFFELLGARDRILSLTIDYMALWLVGLPFFTVALVGSTLMRAMGDAVTPGYLMAIGSGLHVVIAPVFIFGLIGAPKMGLSGAAISFVLARSVSFLMYSYVMVFRDKLLYFGLSGFVASCRDILHVGFPAIASNLIAPVSMTVVTRLLAGHGAVVVAGYGVASRIEALVVMIVWALSMSVAPFVGQNWGAGCFDRVKLALRLANGFAMIWGVIAYTFLFFTAGFLVSLINDDSDVVSAAVNYLLIVPITIGFMGVMANSTSSFNALGRPVPPLIISILQMLIIYLPLAILGDRLFGYIGIYIAGALTISSVGTLSWFWLRREIETGIRRRIAD